MSFKLRDLTIGVLALGALTVFAPDASARTTEKSCDVANDTHHCCKCDPNATPNGCDIDNHSGRLSCTASACCIDICVLG